MYAHDLLSHLGYWGTWRLVGRSPGPCATLATPAHTHRPTPRGVDQYASASPRSRVVAAAAATATSRHPCAILTNCILSSLRDAVRPSPAGSVCVSRAREWCVRAPGVRSERVVTGCCGGGEQDNDDAPRCTYTPSLSSYCMCFISHCKSLVIYIKLK